MKPPRSGKGSYGFQLATVSATLVFFFSLAVTVVVIGSGLLAIGLSLILAFFGFLTTILFASHVERSADRTSEFPFLGSVVKRDEIVASTRLVLRSLNRGLIAAAVPAILAGVAYILTVFSLPAVPALNLLALGTGFVALLFANHTSSLLSDVSQKSQGTIWREPLLRVKVFVWCAAIYTTLAGAVAVLVWLTPGRIYLLDWASFMASLFTYYFVIDTKTATLRAIGIVIRTEDAAPRFDR